MVNALGSSLADGGNRVLERFLGSSLVFGRDGGLYLPNGSLNSRPDGLVAGSPGLGH